jgi:hypothetical protein
MSIFYRFFFLILLKRTENGDFFLFRVIQNFLKNYYIILILFYFLPIVGQQNKIIQNFCEKCCHMFFPLLIFFLQQIQNIGKEGNVESKF